MSQIPPHYVKDEHGNWCHPSRVISGITPNGELVRVYVPPQPVEPPKRIRQSTKPLMNKLETEWFDVLKVRHRIVCAQSLRFMLGNGIWYKPDFIAWPSGLESEDRRMRAFEVKGPFAHRGGLENLKVAAHKYPQIKWTLVWKQDGKWQEQTVWP